MEGKKNTIITVIFVVIFAVAVFGIFFYVKNLSDKRSKDKAEQNAQPTEVKLILALDFNSNYPETARAVVKVYSRIVKAMHNEKLEEGQLAGLQIQMRKLFDEELLENNSIGDQLNALKLEILDYNDHHRTIEDYLVDSANNAESWTYEKQEYYRIITNYTVKEGATVGNIYEEFILRKDESGKWKILGWRRVDKDGLPTDK